MSKPARLGKCNSNEILEKQLSISVKELLIVFIICVLFVSVIMVMTPQTYGFL